MYLQAVGIKTTIRLTTFDAMMPILGSRKVYAIYPHPWSPREEPLLAVQAQFYSTATRMYGAEDKALDAMIDKGIAELDYNKRKEIQFEIARYMDSKYRKGG